MYSIFLASLNKLCDTMVFLCLQRSEKQEQKSLICASEFSSHLFHSCRCLSMISHLVSSPSSFHSCVSPSALCLNFCISFPTSLPLLHIPLLLVLSHCCPPACLPANFCCLPAIISTPFPLFSLSSPLGFLNFWSVAFDRLILLLH